jgi:CheY-like chemotaxis protein
LSLPLGRPGETILVVDDEPRVRTSTAEILSELGYVVFQADGGYDALRVLKEYPEISLLLTDVVMPEMTGWELSEIAVFHRPMLKVVHMTGYAHEGVVRDGIVKEGVELLLKPFNLNQLSHKVRSALDARAAA